MNYLSSVFHPAAALANLTLLENGAAVDRLLSGVEAAAVCGHVGAGGIRVMTGSADGGGRADDPVVRWIGRVCTGIEGCCEHIVAQRQRVACFDMATEAVGQIARILYVGLVVDMATKYQIADKLWMSTPRPATSSVCVSQTLDYSENAVNKHRDQGAPSPHLTDRVGERVR